MRKFIVSHRDPDGHLTDDLRERTIVEVAQLIDFLPERSPYVIMPMERGRFDAGYTLVVADDGNWRLIDNTWNIAISLSDLIEMENHD